MNKLILIPALLTASFFAAAQGTTPAPAKCCEAKNADGTPASACCKENKDCCKPAPQG